MSHGIDVLLGTNPDHKFDLPITPKRAIEWKDEICALGTPAVKGLDMGIMAARILAGEHLDKLENGKLRRPFVLSADSNDTCRQWFGRGFSLLVPHLKIDVNFDYFVYPPTKEVTVATHRGENLTMTSFRQPKTDEHDFNTIPSETIEVISFQIYTPEEYKAFIEAGLV